MFLCSGCEGDDEESSVEGPSPLVMATPTSLCRQRSLFLQPRPPGGGGGGRGPGSILRWWENPHPQQDLDPLQRDESLKQIMSGSYPLLTTEGQKVMDQVCHTLSPEFKHPGRLGVCGGRGTGGGGGGGEGSGIGGGGRKKRCKPRELTSPLTLRAVNQKISSFVQDQSADTVELKFNLVSRAMCKTISALAHVYQLDCFIEQKRRLPVASPVLRKTRLTRLAAKEEIEPILRRHGQEGFVTGLFIGKEAGPHSRSKSHDLSVSHSHSGGVSHSHFGGVSHSHSGGVSHTHFGGVSHSHPGGVSHSHFGGVSHSHSGGVSHSHSGGVSLVGEGCKALDEGNMGNRMLQGMGWRPGTGLGPENSGITSPVRAYLRTKRAGLGFT